MSKTRLIQVLVVVLAVILTSSFILAAAELDVPDEYGTIQEAVDAANPGDTILIAEGSYEGDVNISKNDLTFKSTGNPEATTIRGAIIIESASGTAINGLTVTGGGDGIRVQGNCRGPQPTLTIRNSSISGNSGDGLVISGSYQGVNLENSNINYNGGDGVILSGTGKGVVLNGNEISHNGVTEATGVGVRVGSQVSEVVIENNTMVGNAFANIHPTS